jgi:proton glutamate symport protein
MPHYRWIKSTPVILGCLVVGVVIGIYFKGIAATLAPFSDLYLAFLTMCVVPVMATALVSSLARLLLTQEVGPLLTRTVLVFTIALLVVGATGVVFGLIGRPGAGLTSNERSMLGQLLIDSVVSPQQRVDEGASPRPGYLEVIPVNLFTAFVEGNMLQILFVSLVFGTILGRIPSSTSESLVAHVELVFRVFQYAISSAMYVLPFALLAIMANHVAEMGLDTFWAMIRFVLLIHGAAVLLMVLSAAVISVSLRISVSKQFEALRETLLLAFGTQSSMATIPTMLKALRENLNLSPGAVDLVVSAGVLLCRYSVVLLFALGLVFTGQMYFITLDVVSMVLIVVLSIVAAVGSAGMPALVALSMLSVVAPPLGLPFGVTLVLLIAILPIIDPVITVANVHLNVATAVVIAGRPAPRAVAAGQ